MARIQASCEANSIIIGYKLFITMVKKYGLEFFKKEMKLYI